MRLGEEGAVAYVVVIESDAGVGNLLAEFFRERGHRCGVAHSTRVAQRFLRRVKLDIILVECLLRDGDGLQFARLASNTGIPAIVLSTNPDRAPEAEQTGLIYLQKPFKLVTLSTVIATLLGVDRAEPAGQAAALGQSNEEV